MANVFLCCSVAGNALGKCQFVVDTANTTFPSNSLPLVSYFPFAFTHFMFHFSYCNLLAYRTPLQSFGLVMSADIQFFITIGVDSSLLLAQPYFNHFLKKSLKCLGVGRFVRQNTIFSV